MDLYFYTLPLTLDIYSDWVIQKLNKKNNNELN